jgi:hypothetical protein
MADTEKLIGGPGDGMEVPKTDQKYGFAGREGDNKISVYFRRADGRLHFHFTIADAIAKALIDEHFGKKP